MRNQDEPFDLVRTRQLFVERFPVVNNHPDVAGVLRDPQLLDLLGPALAHPFVDSNVTVVVSPEARGPIVGALVAQALGTGLVLARKKDRNHPGADIPVLSAPNWTGTREVFLARSFDLTSADRVLLVDDWVTTGNTLRALKNVLNVMGAQMVGCAVLMNKARAETIDELAIHTLVNFDEIVSPANEID